MTSLCSLTTSQYIQCPHCNDCIYIEEINCGIFRHGVFKATREQIPPHASNAECDRHVLENTIYGCGKPFRVSVIQDNLVVEICDYV
jgi:hypothetical protein